MRKKLRVDRIRSTFDLGTESLGIGSISVINEKLCPVLRIPHVQIQKLEFYFKQN